jgi:hypothetical protein
MRTERQTDECIMMIYFELGMRTVLRKQHTNCFFIGLFDNALSFAEIQTSEGLTHIFLLSYFLYRKAKH